ncbi:SdiA-regulated domain-containing protein [Flavobacterium sp.]|uniref:SdiA-regulated domain-containing protein n=1 Tax=Flavobacterium sp. TaxID=239 RepID=UPI002B80450A|nr:SdiA-regulated domain-containing protein [Flavobacterium sp.]HSD08332.1 SdiA-regulated domain-containing protein [Flavobacterium sp.]
MKRFLLLLKNSLTATFETKSTVIISNRIIGLAFTPLVLCFNQSGMAQSIDLSKYVRVGRYNLPEPTRTAHPANNLLAQEASAITYNWDTNTLFVVGDGSTAIVQVSKTGELIDTMTLAQGTSPQGTEFYDTEGITYIGNGQFVMTEERDRQVVLFTYVTGTTLTRSNTKTVKLGTFVNNIGTEGLSYDPKTNGYIVLKEISPMGIFQTGIDFNAGTATNGSATTENSVNLFDPSLLGVTDVADVFALSNLPALASTPLYDNLLVLSQESAKVVNTDRNGTVTSTLNIVSDPENPLDAPSQQHEGLTMDRDGILYIANENGGGDIDHPQLWVYAPSSSVNQAPTAIALSNTINSILENSNTSTAVKIADILVTDDGLGTNNLSLSGVDAAFFQIIGSALYIKAGTVLDYETKTSYAVTINVDDATIGSTPDASVNFTLLVTDVAIETSPTATVSITEIATWSSSNSLVNADWFEVTNNGTSALDITGWKIDDSSKSFAAALPLNGITSIAPGESVIFLETSSTNAASIIADFKSAWFGSNVPTGLQIGSYTGSGAGLSTSGDEVNLFDASGNIKANVTFGVATTNLTFNNAAGLTNATITTLSQLGVNDAFAAKNDANQIGSPGSTGKLFISEIAPWASNSSPVGADWFEVTNTKAIAVDITGWKVDDNSQSPAAAVALNGITSINPGESVIFIETDNLAAKSTAFLSNWFGSNPPTNLRIGNYTGSGVGLGTNGDQVNLYNATSSTPQASVLFGVSPTGTFATFDNSAGINTTTTTLSQLSAVGINGAFVAANSSTEIGSPGSFTLPKTTLSVNMPTESTNVFKAIAYPVPTSSTFQLDLSTTSNDLVGITVYDMNGKLVEDLKLDSNELKNHKIGNNYSTGIYTIVLKQGESIKTLRVIKK